MITLHQIHALLVRMEFPATKAELLEQAMKMGAPSAALQRLRGLPDYFYGSVDTVMDALKGEE